MVPVDLSVQPVVQRGQPGPVLVGIAGRPDDLLIVGAGPPRRPGLAWPRPGGTLLAWPMRHARSWPCRTATLAQAGRGLHGWALRARAEHWTGSSAAAATSPHRFPALGDTRAPAALMPWPAGNRYPGLRDGTGP